MTMIQMKLEIHLLFYFIFFFNLVSAFDNTAGTDTLVSLTPEYLYLQSWPISYYIKYDFSWSIHLMMIAN